MSKGFSISGGAFTVTNDARTVFTTDNIPILLLPDSYNLTVSAHSVTFPDPPNDYAYYWSWVSNYNFLDEEYGYANSGAVIFTRKPQEYSASDILGATPAGADVLFTKMKCSRTSAPSHTWLGTAVPALPIQSQWMPFTGSVLMEAAFGMARTISLDISGGNVVLEREQSISTGAGGFGSGGDSAPAFEANSSGWEMVYNSGAGVPVYLPSGSPYEKSTGTQNSSVKPSLLAVSTHRVSGSDPCSTTDPTNYASTWSLDFEIAFGRRS